MDGVGTGHVSDQNVDLPFEGGSMISTIGKVVSWVAVPMIVTLGVRYREAIKSALEEGLPNASAKIAGVTETVYELIERVSGEGALSEGALSEGALSEDALSEGALSEDALSEGALSEGALSEGALFEDALSEGALSEGALSEGDKESKQVGLDLTGLDRAE